MKAPSLFSADLFSDSDCAGRPNGTRDVCLVALCVCFLVPRMTVGSNVPIANPSQALDAPAGCTPSAINSADLTLAP